MIVTVLLCALLASVSLLRVSQGLYEDHQQMIALHGPMTSIVAPRGIARASLWLQSHWQPTPIAIRVWNLWLGVLIAFAVGRLASQFNLAAWPAIGVMLLHPLRVETMALMSGRYELIAALGIVGACLCVARNRITARHLLGALGCLAFAWLGKQTALIGVPLVALTLWARQATGFSRRFGWRLFACSVLIVIALSLRYWDIGATPTIHGYGLGAWLLLQSTAAWRLSIMLVLPQHQTVDFDYDSIGFIFQMGALIGLLLYTVSIALVWRSARTLAYAMTWPALVVLPRLIVQTPKSYLNEYQMFLGLVGVALAIAWSHARLEQWCSQRA